MLDTAKKLHLARAGQEEGPNAFSIDPTLQQQVPGRSERHRRLPRRDMESARVMQ
jgi:hypothetical protein